MGHGQTWCVFEERLAMAEHQGKATAPGGAAREMAIREARRQAALAPLSLHIRRDGGDIIDVAAAAFVPLGGVKLDWCEDWARLGPP